MELPERPLLFSLKPKYADLVLSGRKTVELRRVRPQAPAGALALIYASTPVRAIVGTCVVGEIGAEPPSVVWRLHGPATGLRWHEFAQYFRGAPSAVAITLRQPRWLTEPVTLERMRADPHFLAPPQSFRYLTVEQVKTLLPGEWERRIIARGSVASSQAGECCEDRPLLLAHAQQRDV